MTTPPAQPAPRRTSDRPRTSDVIAGRQALPRLEGGMEALLALAAEAGATDAHLTGGQPLHLRIASDLHPRTEPVPAAVVERIVAEIVPAHLAPVLERSGSCQLSVAHGANGRCRVHVSRQRTGLKISARLLPPEVPSLASLDLPEAIASGTRYAQGLVLVVGPAGQGKSSTLAAIVGIVNATSASHVVTIEDPIEFSYPKRRSLVIQREIGAHVGSVPRAISDAMRAGADVIAIGELRDAEAIRAAVHASANGHLVLATMASPSAAKTVDRLLAFFADEEHGAVRLALAGALRLIVGQRLIPSADRTRLHAAVELLPSSIALYALVRDGRTSEIPALQQRGRAHGVVRLEESLSELVLQQKVTLEEAQRVAESPGDLKAMVSRAPAAAAWRAGE